MEKNLDKPYANTKSYIDGFIESYNLMPNLWFVYIRCIVDELYKMGYQDGLKEQKNANSTVQPK